MTSPDTEITHSPELRDKIFEHLPAQARHSLMGVEVKFWPTNHGEMVLCLKYDATDSLLDIDATEQVYGPDERFTGSLVKGCELDSETGEIHAYTEGTVSEGLTGPFDLTLVEAEIDATRFDAGKLEFLLNLFDHL